VSPLEVWRAARRGGQTHLFRGIVISNIACSARPGTTRPHEDREMVPVGLGSSVSRLSTGLAFYDPTAIRSGQSEPESAVNGPPGAKVCYWYTGVWDRSSWIVGLGHPGGHGRIGRSHLPTHRALAVSEVYRETVETGLAQGYPTLWPSPGVRAGNRDHPGSTPEREAG
jgi:hypothetical protein